MVSCWILFFFFNDTATTEIYTLSLHDALPILALLGQRLVQTRAAPRPARRASRGTDRAFGDGRSEEHTSELQSQSNLVCRLLLEKKNTSYTCPPTFFLRAPDQCGECGQYARRL